MIKKEYEKRYCEQCGEIIPKSKTQSIAHYQTKRFCKVTCWDKWNTQNNREDVPCSYCGKVLRKRKSHIFDHNFCDMTCQNRYKTECLKIGVVCAWCGISFKKVKSQLHTKKNFCSRKCMGDWQSKFWIGENAPGWTNGNATINQKIRTSRKTIEWRLSIFKRDNFSCVNCGDKRGGNLNAHHIVGVNEIIKKFNISESIDFLSCDMLWDIDNGITLCEKCHIEFHKQEGYDR